MLNDFLGVDLTGLRPKPTARRSFGTSTFAIPFLRDVESFVPDTIESKKIVPSLQPNHSLLSFHSLLPGEVSQERCENNADPTGKDAMLETNFTRLLVFSITNNFAGLGDIPIAGILKFLGRYGSIDTMFRQVLKANPRHVAKSLAENLFKAAIEAQDSGIVKQLLDTSFLEVNEIVCEVDRRKLTATERAAQLRDLKTMDLLLAARADVNKSFEPWPMGGGPLKRLYDGICLGETVPDVTNIAQALIGAGAKVHADMLRDVIQRKRHSDLAFCLLQKLLPTHETDLISNSMLSLITQRLDEEQVYKSTEQILEVCESRHERQCFRKFESQVESALVHSASRGFLQVVQMLLPYAKSLYHPLIASLRGGKREVIEAILAKNSEFNPPAHENDIDRSGNFSKTINLHSEMTTPLAEAIRMKADDLIHLCEKKGALDHLDLEGHFNAALAAAATTGNLPYIYKLFQYRPLPPPSEMSTALLYSIQSGHDDISFELIAAGASFFTENPSEHDPLFAAILQRNAPVVRAILDADSSYIPLSSYDVAGKRRTVIDEAIRWGDRSIILDLHLAFPSARINHPDILEEAIGAEKDDLITFLIDLDLVDIFCLTRSLVGPIKKGDTAMVNRLIELGAEPSDSRNLSLAAEYQPRILKVLLEYIPRPVRKPLAGIGTEAVKTTIRLGLAGLEPLEDLLSSKVVDFESFGMEDFRNFEICNQGPESPLGLAIRQAVDCMGEFPIVRRLIKAGCNPNSVVSMERSSNITALLAAIKTKRIDLVKLLIDEGAEVNTKTTRRLTRTPLQLAAELGCLEIVKLLLEKGAEVDALPVQRGGGTALQLAAISGNCNIAVELLNHDAKVWASPSSWQGRWPIEGAAEHGRLDMIALLLKVMDYDSEKFERAMKLAQDNGHLGCRDLIQDHVNQCELMSQYPTTTSERQIESAGLF
jgi:ankyrin repeat protein